MFAKSALLGVMLAMGATALMPATPAAAQRYHHADRDDRYRPPPRPYRRDDRRLEYRARHRCHGGDGGTIIGAIAGGLLGHSIVSGGDRTFGTVAGAGAGALAGHAIDRSNRPGYCR